MSNYTTSSFIKYAVILITLKAIEITLIFVQQHACNLCQSIRNMQQVLVQHGRLQKYIQSPQWLCLDWGQLVWL